jgi:hypothetical protein
MSNKEYVRELCAGYSELWALDQLADELDKRDKQIAKLQKFIRELSWSDNAWCRDISGRRLESMLEDRGLIDIAEITEPCCDECKCAEWYGVDKFPLVCYRWSGAMSR